MTMILASQAYRACELRIFMDAFLISCRDVGMVEWDMCVIARTRHTVTWSLPTHCPARLRETCTGVRVSLATSNAAVAPGGALATCESPLGSAKGRAAQRGAHSKASIPGARTGLPGPTGALNGPGGPCAT
eukprot:CAMPEP_0205999086 /NCGR_PEP_ID=MMETSP1464-20131121/642_1 /ASSEMBLY_ACC=CAM_ASM_001124 /TAXON_ID=119497 /ORGANISM="Exanthemachrysis gayraliae, Strain RCC1523" /LENGTH=130 /DNA_ID=CAMNT_0053372269 /DNA_START=72 /DNA_END=464 /DNA_ORIENTATION=+